MTFRDQLEAILCDRRSPEAAALFETLLKYVHKRVTLVAWRSGRGVMTANEIEELCGEVLLQLMSGALVRFKGESLPELLSFCRTMSDRIAWRAVSRKRREQKALQEAGIESMDRWTSTPPGPDQYLELIPDSPLSEADQAYLRELLVAGTKAELARQAGVSRAAVTQRVQRIRSRIDALSLQDQQSHEAWMHAEAREALQR